MKLDEFLKELKKIKFKMKRDGAIRTAVDNVCPISAVGNRKIEENKDFIPHYHSGQFRQAAYYISLLKEEGDEVIDFIVSAADYPEFGLYMEQHVTMRRELLKACGLEELSEEEWEEYLTQ